MVDDHPAVAEQLLEGDVTARVHGGETPLKVGALDGVCSASFCAGPTDLRVL